MKYHIQTETSVPALMNELEAFRQIICDGSFRNRGDVASVARAHGFLSGTGGNHVWINASDESGGGERIALVTVEGNNGEWPDTAPFTLEEGLQMQSRDLYAWQAVLRPDSYQKVLAQVVEANRTTKTNLTATGLDVVRGRGISGLVHDQVTAFRNADLCAPFQSKMFIVMTMGTWGRGKTIQEAAKVCLKNGAKRTQLAVVKMIMGDNTPEISRDGCLITASGSETYDLGSFPQLSGLLSTEE